MASHLHPAGPSLVGSARPGVRRAELIDLVGLVAKPLPLSVLLDEVPPRIARVARFVEPDSLR